MKPKYIHMRGKSQKDMAARTKLIITNSYVKQYDFYKDGNICVVDKDNPVVPEDFFEQLYEDIDQSVL